MRAVAVLGLALGLLSGPALAEIKTPPLGCAAFMKALPEAAPTYRVSFERPLTISRGFGEALSGIDVRILSTNAEVDGTLKCRGDDFLRFELRIKAPTNDHSTADFETFGQAALIAGFRWDRGKAQTVAKALSADAADYLRGSEQRGDIYLAGKVEYHQGDALDLGMIFTPTDHTLIIANQSDS